MYIKKPETSSTIRLAESRPDKSICAEARATPKIRHPPYWRIMLEYIEVKKMELNKTAVAAAFFMFAVLAVSVFAADTGAMAGGDNKDKTKETGYYLQARAQYLSCTIDFSTTVMNSVVNAVPQGSDTLTADIAKLNSDKSQLSSLASAGDPKAFDDFASGTLKSDTKQSVSDLHAARQGL